MRGVMELPGAHSSMLLQGLEAIKKRNDCLAASMFSEFGSPKIGAHAADIIQGLQGFL